uniref:Transmembrane protein 202 n=2 Tax=Rousettus aegyptiacus TaxID=9407 RepID=A0A7J8CII4_ROUAE|nr:hypothetical protein HJG63_009130 [Rousettus aegyptiacus]
MQQDNVAEPRFPELYSPPEDLNFYWEERKFILRAWALVFSALATLMMLSVLDGCMAYMQGPYTGYVGIWDTCRRCKCASLGQVPVLVHMSMGFMMLALALCIVLLFTMGLSFWPFLRRLIKVDLVFSFLSFSIVNCETLKPRPQVSYQETAYLCWGSSALMLWAGVLSYLNHMGVRSKRSLSFEMQAMYRQWVVRQSSSRNEYARQSGANL